MDGHPSDELSVEQWQDLLLEAEDVTDFLDEFVRTLAAALGDGTDGVWCAVTVLRMNKPATVSASDHRATVLDELQYSFRDGPCLTAIREHTVVHVEDTRTSAPAMLPRRSVPGGRGGPACGTGSRSGTWRG